MKTKEEAKANLEQSLTFVGDRYKAGVGRADWATAAASDNAEKNFATAMSNAIAKKTRQNGVKKVSNTTWQELAIVKGGAVIADRMRGALEKQAANFGAVYDKAMPMFRTLPARTTDFRTNITNRVVGSVEAWKKAAGKL